MGRSKLSVALVDPETGEHLANANLEGLEKQDKKQNRDFVMLYRKFISQIADLGMRDATALKILLFLVKHMDNRNALAVNMSLISTMTGVTRQTVSLKLKYLHNNGWITICKIGHQNIYIVNPDVVWTAYDREKAYCKFDAKVMLDKDDNWHLNNNRDVARVKHIDKDALKYIASKMDEVTKPQDNQIPGQLSFDDIGLMDPDADSDAWLKDPEGVSV